MSTCEDRCSINTAETLSMVQVLPGLAAANGPGCTAASTSDGRVLACCDKIFFLLEMTRSCSVHSGIQKQQRGAGVVGILVDVVKPVDDVEEGEGEGEYYP